MLVTVEKLLTQYLFPQNENARMDGKNIPAKT